MWQAVHAVNNMKEEHCVLAVRCVQTAHAVFYVQAVK